MVATGGAGGQRGWDGKRAFYFGRSFPDQLFLPSPKHLSAAVVDFRYLVAGIFIDIYAVAGQLVTRSLPVSPVE
jgi:hypothetical protein